MFSVASSLSDFSIEGILGGIKPILGSLSPVAPGDVSNVEDTCVCILDLLFWVFFHHPVLRHFRENLFAFSFPIFCCGLSVI